MGARRLTQLKPVLTNVACEARLGSSANAKTSVATLNSDDFALRLAARTLAELGKDSPAVKGELGVISKRVHLTSLHESGGEDSDFNSSFFGLTIAVAAFFGLAAVCIAYCAYQRRKAAQAQPTEDAAMVNSRV